MLILGFALMLATVSVASFPCWTYSGRWGFLPCTASGIALFFVAMIAVGGRPNTGEATETRAANAALSTLPAAVPTPTRGFTVDSSRQPIPLPRHGAAELALQQ